LYDFESSRSKLLNPPRTLITHLCKNGDMIACSFNRKFKCTRYHGNKWNKIKIPRNIGKKQKCNNLNKWYILISL